jgi:hypothetical protein
MPFTFRGVGTCNYGSRDFRPNGSYVTTQWFVFIYLPIIPLKSERILPVGNNWSFMLLGSRRYQVLERVPLNISQVLMVYGWFATTALAFWVALKFDMWLLWIPGILMFFLPEILRKRAIREIHERHAREQMGLAPKIN